MRLTKKQMQVFQEVKTRLQKRDWFRGVCIDNFPSDVEIEQDFEKSVEDVMMETAMWDNPSCF